MGAFCLAKLDRFGLCRLSGVPPIALDDGLQKMLLHELGQASEENDVSFHLYEAARLLIDSIDVKTNFDRSHDFARKYVRTAIEFSLLGLGFSSAEEALEYMTSDE